jgi:hypothetical protein
MPHFLPSKHGCVYRDGKPPPGGGRSKSSVGFSKTIPIPCGLSSSVGNATEIFPRRGLCHNQGVSVRRVYVAGIVLGLTFAAAVWLVTYRVWDVVQYIEYIGGKRHYFHPSERVRVQPWWGVPAAVAVMLVGSGISLRLLPGSRGLVKRLADHFAKLSERDRDRRATAPRVSARRVAGRS